MAPFRVLFVRQDRVDCHVGGGLNKVLTQAAGQDIRRLDNHKDAREQACPPGFSAWTRLTRSMMQPRLAALTIAALLMGLAACAGTYTDQIQGAYGSSFKRGGEAMRDKDYERAVEHYAYAAESGHPRALIAYGRLFAKGNGVERDPARAVTLLQEAYEKTSDFRAKAALEMAQIYMKGGDGPSGSVNRNEVLARALFEQALDGGEYKAATSLGRIYDKGIGVDRDPDQAIALLPPGCDPRLRVRTETGDIDDQRRRIESRCRRHG